MQFNTREEPLAAMVLPAGSYLRLRQIVGNKKKGEPPVPGILPVSRSHFLQMVKDGKAPQPVRTLGQRVTCWKASDIIALAEGRWIKGGEGGE